MVLRQPFRVRLPEIPPTHRRFVSGAIKIAGGAKCPVALEQESEREIVPEQIRKSMRLHGTMRVILMLHSDCGAYGGLAGGFKGDARAEAEHHEQELRRAAATVAARFPGVEVRS